MGDFYVSSGEEDNYNSELNSDSSGSSSSSSSDDSQREGEEVIANADYQWSKLNDGNQHLV